MSLRVDFTFETFVPTPFAAEALRLSTAMATRQAASHACVLQGPAGIGKTHLLHAIGHRTRLFGGRIAVTTARDLAREVVDAVRADRIEEMRARGPDCDLLIVDDFQDLAGKPATLGEVCRILAAWTKAGTSVAGASALPQTELAGPTSARDSLSIIRWLTIRRPTFAEIRPIAVELFGRHSLNVTVAGCRSDRAGLRR
jgi:chromosomal replication initiator protein